MHFFSLWQLSQFEDAKLSWDISFCRQTVFGGFLGVFLFELFVSENKLSKS